VVRLPVVWSSLSKMKSLLSRASPEVGLTKDYTVLFSNFISFELIFLPEERAVSILAFATFTVSLVGDGFFFRFFDEAL
jgi:hypothetical protein